MYSQDFEWWYANTVFHTSDEIKQAAWHGWEAALKRATAPEAARRPVAWMIRHKGCEVGPIETVESTALRKAAKEGAEEVVPLYSFPSPLGKKSDG